MVGGRKQTVILGGTGVLGRAIAQRLLDAGWQVRVTGRDASRPAVFLADAGAGGDHTTAAVNTAALVETVATNPGRRVLNSADPDAHTGLDIARTIADYLGHHWEEILLDAVDDLGLGAHPWNLTPPLILDTQASTALGYQAVGTYAQTVTAEIDWLLANPANQAGRTDPSFDRFTDYALEDDYLATRC